MEWCMVEDKPQQGGQRAPATKSCVLGDTGRAAIGLWSQDSMKNMLNRAAPPQALRVS